MSAVLDMAKDSESRAESDSPSPEVKKNVKVTPAFHKRLKTVAAALGIEMGQLVEREMEEFLTRETGGIPKRMEG